MNRSNIICIFYRIAIPNLVLLALINTYWRLINNTIIVSFLLAIIFTVYNPVILQRYVFTKSSNVKPVILGVITSFIVLMCFALIIFSSLFFING